MERQSLKLQLSRSQNACLGGVCAGLAEHFDLDPIVVRILAILIAAITLGLGALVYIVLWAVLPLGPPQYTPFDVSPEQAESIAYGCVDCASHADANRDAEGLSIVIWLAIVVCLVLLFLLVALNISPMVSGSRWWQFWPAAFVIGGVCLVVVPLKGQRQMAWHALGVVIVALATACLPMSLGIVSWRTLALALRHLWPIVVLAVVLYGVGLHRSNSALAVVAALLMVVFCLVMLTSFIVPGDVAHLLIFMPDGRSLRIALASALPFF
jgi:phage shock protein C